MEEKKANRKEADPGIVLPPSVSPHPLLAIDFFLRLLVFFFGRRYTGLSVFIIVRSEVGEQSWTTPTRPRFGS